MKVAVACDRAVVPAWIERAISLVDELAFVDVTVFVLDGGTSKRRTNPGWFGLYEKLDRLLSREESDACAPVDLRQAFPCRERLDAPIGTGGMFDVILRFGLAEQEYELIRYTRHGVWSIHLGDSRREQSDAPLFWEMYRGDAVTVTELHARKRSEPNHSILLYRSRSATAGTSLQLNRNATYWKTAHFPARRLLQLHQQGWAALEALPRLTPGSPRSARRPTAKIVFRLLARAAYRRLRRFVAVRLHRGQWFIAYRPRLNGEAPASALSQVVPVIPPSDRFFADPFLISHDGADYVFVEDLAFASGKGTISYLELGAKGGASEAVQVLERDVHMSYPFVFSHDDEIFMIPETAEAGTVDLYRASRFPKEWVLERTLMRGVRAYDATLIRYAGRFWLFASIQVENGTPWDELSLFWSENLDGEWIPHPLNPVVSDVRRARPAGRIFSHDGHLVRPAQDCSRHYGHAFSLNRIEELTTESYRERELARINPGWLPGVVGTHSYDRNDRFEVVDGHRRVPKLPVRLVSEALRYHASFVAGAYKG